MRQKRALLSHRRPNNGRTGMCGCPVPPREGRLSWRREEGRQERRGEAISYLESNRYLDFDCLCDMMHLALHSKKRRIVMRHDQQDQWRVGQAHLRCTFVVVFSFFEITTVQTHFTTATKYSNNYTQNGAWHWMQRDLVARSSYTYPTV